MKSNQRQTNFFFPPNPLKAFNPPAEEQKSQLHIYKKEDKDIKRSVILKVLQGIDAPKEYSIKNSTEEKNIQQDHLEERESDWFASYE